jgi:hypothetical protein
MGVQKNFFVRYIYKWLELTVVIIAQWLALLPAQLLVVALVLLPALLLLPLPALHLLLVPHP